MDFDLTAEQSRARDAARDLADRAVAPRAAELDRAARLPADLVAALAEAGLLAPTAPTAEGGAGLDATGYALVVEELSRASASVGAIVRAHGALFADLLLRSASPEQRAALLAPASSGRTLGAFALGAPGDPPPFTAARAQGGAIRVHGSAPLVLLAPEAEHVLAVALLAVDAGPPRPTAVVLRCGEGLRVEPAEPRLGLRALPVGAVHADGATVPPGGVLGAEGDGDLIAEAARDLHRIGVAAQAIGVARAACEEAIAHARAPRGEGEKRLSDHQAIQFLVADMLVEIDAARLLTLRAAALRDRGAPCAAEGAAARLHAAEVASRAAQRALQILGPAGAAAGSGPDRHARDARILEIEEGTTEVQRMIIAGGMLQS